MSTTATTPAPLTAGLVTRLAKAAAPGVRFSSTKVAPGTVRAVVLVERDGRPYDERAEVRALNDARNAMIREGYDASVGRVGSHGHLLTVVEPEPAADLVAEVLERHPDVAAKLARADVRADHEAKLAERQVAEAADREAPFVDVVARHGVPVYLACTADGRVVSEHPTRTQAEAHLPVDLLAGLNPAARAHLVTLAAARAAGLYTVTAVGGVVGLYPTPGEADRVAEQYRARQVGASVARPCGHAWNRTSPTADCRECASIRDLRELRSIGGRLNPQRRAQLEARELLEARLDAIDAETPAVVAELEEQHAAMIESSPLLSAYVARRREELRPVRSAAEVLAEREPSVERPQIVIPREGEVAAAAQAVETSSALPVALIPGGPVERSRAAMSHTERATRQHARDAVAAHTAQEAARSMTPAAVQGLTGAGAVLAEPSPTYGCVQHIERGPSCGPDCDALTAEWNAPRRRDEEELRALALEVGGDLPIERDPLAELRELAASTGANLGADTSRAARHLAAVLRGTGRGVVRVRVAEDGDGPLTAIYEEARGLATVSVPVTAAATMLRDEGLVAPVQGVGWRRLSLTGDGHRLVLDLTFLPPRG